MGSDTKLPVGRPKKPEHEKVQYQRIAVYLDDYEKLKNVLRKTNDKIAVAFGEMVDDYVKKV